MSTHVRSSMFAIEFGSLDDPDHGDVDVSRTTFEGAAIYTCDPDYRLVGDSMRTCLSSGQWSGSAPICKNSGE